MLHCSETSDQQDWIFCFPLTLPSPPPTFPLLPTSLDNELIEKNACTIISSGRCILDENQSTEMILFALCSNTAIS